MFIARFLTLLLAFSLIGQGAATAQDKPQPALWKLSDADTTIYLFGTIHALPKDMVWNVGTVRAAFESADTLAVEVAEANDARENLQPMMAMGLAAPGSLPPLAERVPETVRPALKALIARTPFPPAALDRFETWLAALILVAPAVTDAGLDPETGADRALMAEARARGIATIGLETMAQQLGYFDTLPETDQRALLNATVKDGGDIGKEFRELVAAWAKGDVAKLEKLADDELKASAHLRDVLLTARNARWADWLSQRLASPGTVFVAVGAGHLAGKDSVQKMLEKKRLKVIRVQ